MKQRFRLVVMSLGVISLLGWLVIRLVDVQLLRGAQFRAQAEDNRWYELPIIPPRGVILDRFGEPLVRNQRRYIYLEDPEQLYSEATMIEASQARQLMATAGAQVRRESIRLYPYGEAMAHVLGYVGPITQEEVEKNPEVSRYPSSGKLGLERAFERELRGLPGTERFEIDARVRRQRRVAADPATPGMNIRTTLDPYLSQVAYDALGDKKGTVVIADARTGALLAMVNKPSFDPNVFSKLDQLSSETEKAAASSQVQAWFASDQKPFFNRAVSGNYPPGSIFKMVTALAGLEVDAFDTSTTVLDEGILEVGEYEYANWYFTQFGRTEGEISVVRALARSNDIFFYKAAEWIGPTQLASMARLFGLGQPVGLEIGPEGTGLVPDPQWKEEQFGERWFLGNTYHFGIGQGDLQMTPVQALQLTQIMANHGALCKPHLLQENEELDCIELGIKDEHLDVVLRGMLDACSPSGTAFPFFERNGQLRQENATVDQDLNRGAVACKTGTAEFGAADERGYRDTHGWWVGIVEPQVSTNEGVEESNVANTEALIEPTVATSAAVLRQKWLQHIEGQDFPERLVFAVLVESDEADQYREGSGDAAPVAAQILDWMESL